jgi:hypothetical protein
MFEFILGTVLTLLGYLIVLWAGLTRLGQPSLVRIVLSVCITLVGVGYLTWGAYDARQELCGHAFDPC